MAQTQQDKAIHANFKKGREVRIKSGDLEGHFGKITRVTDDDGQRFLRVKIDKLKKISWEKTWWSQVSSWVRFTTGVWQVRRFWR